MADDKIYSNEVIKDNPLPETESTELSSTQETGDSVYSQETIKEKLYPHKIIASETIGVALNTLSRKIMDVFEFTKMGAIRIGEYVAGVTGEIDISPSGITAKNTSGDTTFAIDGETGNATFKGTVQAGSFIAGDNQVVIDEVDGNGRILISDGKDYRVLLGYDKDGF